MSLLGEYLNTYQRANPAQGLMQGFQTGSNFMFARNQQKMQQEQIKQQEAEREKQGDMKMVSVLFDQASKSNSKMLRAQYTQRAHDYLKKYDPIFDATVDPNDESFDQYVSKIRKFVKPLVDNPDEGIKDLRAFLVEIAEAQDKGLIDDKKYKQLIDEATNVKKEAAGELGGLAIYPEQFRNDPAYQTPEAKEGIEGYQNTLYSQMTTLGEGTLANQIKGAQNRDRALPLDFGDKELIKKSIPEIQKLKREAIVSKTMVSQIKTALDFAKTGKVTGKGGQIKASLAPYAEMFGVNTDNLGDAQMYQLLTRAIIGPMRLEIVGPGPVSEWEQKLMQTISGGGDASKTAAITLLNHWKKISHSKIDNYNDTLTGFAKTYPNISSVYKPVTLDEEQPDSKPSGNKALTWEELKKKKGY